MSLSSNYSLEQDHHHRWHFVSHQPFYFKNGASIPELELVFETYGKCNDKKDNVILIHHALSTDSHVAAHPDQPDKTGWWKNMVGPGCYIDTNQYYVICINNLGSCFGSSGPSSIDPRTKQTYRLDFPEVTIADMVASQHLLLQTLGITHLYAIISASMGAMLSLEWAITYPDNVARLVTISSCDKAYPLNRAIRHIKRQMICMDPAWQNGNYAQSPLPGFSLARQLSHLYYRDVDDFNQRFLNEDEARADKSGILSYLSYNAEKFTKKFDPNSYLYLMRAMDTFDVSAPYAGDRMKAFSRMQARTRVIAVSSDTLFPPSQQKALYDALKTADKQADFICHQSANGHDTFLIEVDCFGAWIQEILATHV
jgi:homoserine O-acetyltransferase